MLANQNTALESNTTQQSQSQIMHNDINAMANNLPWGLISILAIMLVIGLVIFKRKNPVLSRNSDNMPSSIKLKLTKVTNKELQAALNNQIKNTSINDDPNQINNNNYRMADGVESRYFLLQAKGIFLHLNQLNIESNAIEVNKYLSPELGMDISDKLPKGSNLDSKDINCQLIDTKIQANNSLIAMVKFTTNTNSNTTTALPSEFNQTWQFIKPDTNISSKWLVAAIQ